MQIVDNLIIMLLHVLCFVAGMKIANHYNNKAALEKKDALERQFVRLQTRSDADDPCRPYLRPLNTGDPDGDSPIGDSFMQSLKEHGKAAVRFRKSDIAK